MKRFKIIKLALALLSLSTSLLVTADEYVYETDSPVIAIGDVHGAYTELVSLLQGVGLIDGSGRWVGGETHLVSLGDLVDRGPDSKSVMDLMMQLQAEAPGSGGRVHVLLGNHELMNIGGDLRDVSESEYRALGGPEGHRQAFSENGEYGAWLRRLPVAIQINDSLFAHGGLSSLAGKTLEEVNGDFWQAAGNAISEGQKLQSTGLLPSNRSLLDPLNVEEIPEALQSWQDATRSRFIGLNSVVWYRGNVSCHPLIEEQNVRSVLAQHGARRIIVGHTPTGSREIETRYDGRVVAIDTGMLASIYRGQPRALLVENTDLKALLPDGTSQKVRAVDRVRRPVDLTIEMKQRQAKREVAAYRLSAYLGFDFVLNTELAESGVKQAIERTITERERQERQLYRANNCEAESDFDLLSVFDSLIGKRDRTIDSLAYSRASWHIVALDHGSAFDSSSKLPSYANVPKLNSSLRARLVELDQERLTEVLGDLLRTREISAILKRRDKILAWPSPS